MVDTPRDPNQERIDAQKREVAERKKAMADAIAELKARKEQSTNRDDEILASHRSLLDATSEILDLARISNTEIIASNEIALSSLDSLNRLETHMENLLGLVNLARDTNASIDRLNSFLSHERRIDRRTTGLESLDFEEKRAERRPKERGEMSLLGGGIILAIEKIFGLITTGILAIWLLSIEATRAFFKNDYGQKAHELFNAISESVRAVLLGIPGLARVLDVMADAVRGFDIFKTTGAVGKFFSGISMILGPLKGLLSGPLKVLGMIFAPLRAVLVGFDAIGGAWKRGMATFEKTGNIGLSILAGVYGAVEGIVVGFTNAIMGLINLVGGALLPPDMAAGLRKITDMVSGVVAGVFDFMFNLWDNIGKILGEIPSYAENLAQMGAEVWDMISKTFNNIAASFVGGLMNLVPDFMWSKAEKDKAYRDVQKFFGTMEPKPIAPKPTSTGRLEKASQVVTTARNNANSNVVIAPSTMTTQSSVTTNVTQLPNVPTATAYRRSSLDDPSMGMAL